MSTCRNSFAAQSRSKKPSTQHMQAQLGGMQAAFFDGDTCPLTYAEDAAYSPPPSPTLRTFISRFESTSFYSSFGTPSLMNETLPTAVSSPYLNHTPMQYTTTRDPRPEPSTRIGLGFTGLFMADGSVFDGMGALPKHNGGNELGFFMDEADDASKWYDNGYPEQEEDAWRTRISSSAIKHGRMQSSRSVNMSSPPPASAARAGHRPTQSLDESVQLLPSEPDMDDVFFSRTLATSTPTLEDALASKERLEMSRAVISSWSRNVQQAKLENVD